MKYSEFEIIEKTLDGLFEEFNSTADDKGNVIQVRVNLKGEVSSKQMRTLLELGEVTTKRSGHGLVLRWELQKEKLRTLQMEPVN